MDYPLSIKLEFVSEIVNGRTEDFATAGSCDVFVVAFGRPALPEDTTSLLNNAELLPDGGITVAVGRISIVDLVVKTVVVEVSTTSGKFYKKRGKLES